MRHLIFTFLLCMSAGMLSAQAFEPEVFGSAGTYSTGTNAALQWTVGETVIETATGSTSILTQGFNQPTYEIVALDEEIISNFDVTVYPNPATNYVNVDVTSDLPEDVNVLLVDGLGRVLQSQSASDREIKLSFDLSQVAQGQYYISVMAPEKAFKKTYKVNKIDR